MTDNRNSIKILFVETFPISQRLQMIFKGENDLKEYLSDQGCLAEDLNIL